MKKNKLKINHSFVFGALLLGSNLINAQCPIPSLVTASPATICAGATTSLNATAAGASITWFTVPTGGSAIGGSASGANFAVSPVTTTTYYAQSNGAATQTYSFTGSIQTYTVPVGVTQVTIDAAGAQGGGSNGGGGGLGARMIGTYTVTAGQVLSVVVPSMGLLQVGGNVQNSSGGGGGAFVYLAGVTPTLLVAAGGGGGKCNYTGSTPLHAGAAGTVAANGNASSDGAALGGVSGAGGGAGLFSSSPCAGGGAGWTSNGGGPYGGIGISSWAGGPGFCGGGGGGCGGVGGFGGGGGGGNHYGGGGGGGGFSGGGGGTDPTHGGGGGSFSSGTAQSNSSGVQLGNGLVTITGNSGGCTSASRTPVVVTVNALPTVSVTSGAICAGQSFTMVGSGASTYTFSSGSAIVSPTANANYNVTGTSAQGCVSSNTAISSVTVNALPTVSVTSGVICAGQSFTMVGSGASTYTFSSGSAVVTPTSNANYNVTGTSPQGCVSSNTAISSVTVNALPTVNASTNASLTCTGQSATLTANGASTYTWNTSATTAVIVINPTVTTTYTVNATGLNGCKNVAIVTQSVSACTGLNSVSAKINGLSIYPNPSNGEFTVELNNGLNKTIEVIDVAGRVVLTTTSLNDKVNVKINNLTNGIYFVKILSNNVTEVIKIVKQ